MTRPTVVDISVLRVKIKMTYLILNEYNCVLFASLPDLSILGYLYDHGHLSRAVCCRLDCDKGSLASQLPVGYRINHPRLGSVTYGAGQRETQKTREFSVNWCLGDRQPEVTDGCKGRLLER